MKHARITTCLQLDLVEGSVAIELITLAVGKRNERKLAFRKVPARRRVHGCPFAHVVIERKLQRLPLQLNDDGERSKI